MQIIRNNDVNDGVEWYVSSLKTKPTSKIHDKLNKCSALAEMGDRLVTKDISQKEGRPPCPFREGSLGRDLPPYQAAS